MKDGKTHPENVLLPCTEIPDSAGTTTANNSLIQSDEAIWDEEVLPQNEDLQLDEVASGPSTSTLNAQGSEHQDIGISNLKGSPPTLKLLQALHNLEELSTSEGHIPSTSSLEDPGASKLTMGSTQGKLPGSIHLPSFDDNLTSLQPQLALGDKQESKKVSSL